MNPSEDIHILFASVVICCGLLTSAFLVGRLATVAAGGLSHVSKILYVRKRIGIYSVQKGVPPDLRGRLESYHRFLVRRTHGAQLEDAIEQLPASLIQLMKSELTFPLYQRHSLFRHAPVGILFSLCSKTKISFFPRNEYIFRRNG